MNLTPEQKAIVTHVGNLKIDAVAGSGKTSTLIEYARRRPASSKMLYLAFNRSVRQEAVDRFRRAGLSNVQVHTAHSLAYKKIVVRGRYKVSQGYKNWELVELLNLPKSRKDPMIPYLVASHIARMMQLFCNSAVINIKDLDYIGQLADKNAIEFAKRHFRMILDHVVILWHKMDKREIPVTHDFYLKKYQMSQPRLPFHYLLFDEGQDASPVMLDIFLQQNGTKVIVGDTHQQIYGWRKAINSLEQVDFPRKTLTTSFRFSQEIADLAQEYLQWKLMLTGQLIPKITGVGGKRKDGMKATLARTNLGLLMRAIDLVYDQQSVGHLYFEGNLNSYTYTGEGGVSVYDVLSLKNEQKGRIRSGMIKRMPSFEGLENFARQAGDPELNMMVEVVKLYGNKLPGLIKGLQSRQVADVHRKEAEMIFSTVHRCKGLEYGEVTLCEDFAMEADVKKAVESYGRKSREANAYNEEINLLYVAVTRTLNQINIPASLRTGFVPTGGIAPPFGKILQTA